MLFEPLSAPTQAVELPEPETLPMTTMSSLEVMVAAVLVPAGKTSQPRKLFLALTAKPVTESVWPPV